MVIFQRTILSLILSVMTIAAFAQSTLTGKVIDSETGEALIASTVRIMSTDTTRLVAGNATTKDGTFTVKSVKDGNYIMKVSYVGYNDFYRAITVNRKANNKGNQAIGTIMMTQSSIQLSQAVVTGELKEMEMKDDTLIFNADAFKVPEGSVLEDLIKKLPGVTIEDGTIKVNGKTVRRILVGGKEFFGNDQNMSMKNLPAEIVDKVKTYDRQSDFSRITGIDDGEEETVLDLTIKKGFQQGWFGNIDAGYGTEKLYSFRGMLNRFSDTMQGNVLGSQNNTGSNGNATARQIGGRLVFDTGTLEIGGNFRFNYNKSNSYTKNSSQNFVRAASYSNSINSNRNRNNNFNSDFRIEWKIDSVTTLQFQPRVSTGKTKSSSGSMSATFNNDPYQNGITDPLSQHDLIVDSIKVNSNESSNWSNGDNYNVSGNLLLNRRLGGGPWFGPSAVTGSNGRNISLRASGTLSENKNKNYNWSNVIYYQQNGREDLTFRLRNNPNDNKNYSIGLTYSEPILRNLIAQANYSYQYSKRHADGQTYDFAKDDEKGKEVWDYYERYGALPPYYGDFLSDSLSRYTDNINKTHNLEFSLRFITQLLNISAGVRIEAQNQKMVYQYQGLDTIASRNISRVSPTLNARLRFTRQHTLRFTYRGNTQQPEMTDLFTLTDNSNPLNIREGNPNLKPSFTHNFNLDYNNYFQATNQSINSNFSYSTTRNSISQRTEYNEETGGQRSRPENINGNWNIRGTIGFNTPLFWSKLSMNASTEASLNNHVSYLYQNQETYKNNTKDISVRERLSITLRLNNFDVRANGSFNYNKTKNKMVETGNQDTYNFNYGLSSTGNFDNGFGFSTDINMSSRRGYSSAEMNTNELIWNAQISYRFLYRKQATISIEARDILNRRSNISRSISANSRSDRETNAIYSYVMAHFIWRFNLFGSSSARRDLREMRSFMNEMPMGGEGPGGPGGRGGDGGGFGGGRGGGGGFGGGGRF